LLKVGQELTLPKLQATPRPSGTVQATAAPRTPTTPAAAATATPAPAAVATQVAPTAAPAAGGTGTYTVVAGDSPGGIPSKLRVPVAQQQAWADQLLALKGASSAGPPGGPGPQLPETPESEA